MASSSCDLREVRISSLRDREEDADQVRHDLLGDWSTFKASWHRQGLLRKLPWFGERQGQHMRCARVRMEAREC